MGAYQMGPPTNLVLALRARFRISTFVEAGTFYGDTAAWAATHFNRVLTIESAALLAEHARIRFSGTKVEVCEGTSVDHLRRLLAELREPACFWLDAHWSGGVTAGREHECPLLEELNLFKASAIDHFILVDDARLFAAPPPRPHDPSHWPALGAVVDALEECGRRHVVLIDDVLVAVPATVRDFIVSHWQDELARRMSRPAWIGRAIALFERLGRRMEKSATVSGGHAVN